MKKSSWLEKLSRLKGPQEQVSHEKRAPGCLGYMGVSKNNGTSKSSILIGFSIINHPFWGTPIFGNTHIGDGKLPSYIGMIIGHDIRILSLNNQYFMESKSFFF